MGWNYLSIPKLQRCNRRWGLGMDKWFHHTLYRECDHLSMLGLKLNHVGPGVKFLHDAWRTTNASKRNRSHLDNTFTRGCPESCVFARQIKYIRLELLISESWCRKFCQNGISVSMYLFEDLNLGKSLENGPVFSRNSKEKQFRNQQIWSFIMMTS